ncbi:MAG: hypothetical protein PVG19_02920 [Desulfobacterales bacterium]|jgi:hypothetical protein
MIVVDTHAHFHPHCDLDEFLTGAYRNLAKAARAVDHAPPFYAVLFVAGIETHALAAIKERPSSLRWQLRSTAETNSILAQASEGHQLVMVLGHQVISEEGLEILGFTPHRTVPAGLPVDQIIARIRASKGIAIIPWGFGKWMGRRKSLVVRLVETWHNNFSIGDNGGRSLFFSSAAIFKKARQKGIRILPGSDPLPIRGETKRIGTCGFCINGRLDLDRPLAHIIQTLRLPHQEVRLFARHANPIEFVIKQVMLRLSMFKMSLP